MSASSGFRGSCRICSHQYNEHNKYTCTGQDKKKVSKGKYEWIRCRKKWVICQEGGHNWMGTRKDAYLVCHDCPSHPGGGPAGTGLDGSFVTADGAQECDGSEEQWLWDATYQRYYYMDADGNKIWDEGVGESSSSAQ